MKGALIDNLIKTKMVIDENEEMSNEYARYYRKAIASNGWVFLILYIASICIFYIKFSDMLLEIVHIELTLLQLCILEIIIPFFILKLLIFSLNKIMLKLRVGMNKKRIAEIKENYYFNLKLMDSYSKVPEKYRYSFCMELLITYIQNKRAANLKEALNLFEKDLKYEQQKGELKRIRLKQRNIRKLENMIIKEVRNAKQAAVRDESATAWSSLG